MPGTISAAPVSSGHIWCATSPARANGNTEKANQRNTLAGSTEARTLTASAAAHSIAPTAKMLATSTTANAIPSLSSASSTRRRAFDSPEVKTIPGRRAENICAKSSASTSTPTHGASPGTPGGPRRPRP